MSLSRSSRDCGEFDKALHHYGEFFKIVVHCGEFDEIIVHCGDTCQGLCGIFRTKLSTLSQRKIT